MRFFCLIGILAGSAAAQTPAPLAFEVASVKISSPDSQGRASMESTPGSMTMRNVTFLMLAAEAYGVQRPQMAGPDWIRSARYDVLAKAGRPASEDEMRPMLRALIEERFKLAVHRESRTMAVMALVLPKGAGHKMAASEATGPAEAKPDPSRGMVVKGARLTELAEDLSHDLDMPVVDLTGLTGRFDFTFNPQKYVEAFRSQVIASRQPVNEAEAKLTLLEEIVAGELGLRLEQRKMAVEVVVIDRADKIPVEN